MHVKQLSINSSYSLKDALVILDNNGLGVLFVVDEQDTLLGLITDGDIRRALIGGIPLDTAVKFVMNTTFVSLPIDSENAEILKNITPKIKIIPLTGENNQLLDYASINKIRRISIASPLLNGNELAYVTDCIQSNWISSQGKYVRQFEELFSTHHEGLDALAVSNGTVALHLALVALGIGKGDEVMVPDLTFAASVNAIMYTGATPVLVDIDPITWNIDLNCAKRRLTPKTKAIMAVHLYGHPCDMDAVTGFASKNNLLVVEDCAEALGSYYKSKPVGTFGDAATFSFYGNKTITTGEGGMVIFKSAEIAKQAAILRDHGMEKERRYWHAQVGFNYRLTNLQAAIGVAQYERLEDFVNAKRHIAKTYNEAFKASEMIQTPVELQDCVNSYWLYTFLIKKNATFTREELMDFMNQNGIETRPVFFPMHTMPPYTEFGNPEELQVSINVSKNGLSLPSSVNLTEVELTHICDTLISFLRLAEGK